MKKLSDATIVGQQGINLIERITLEMGFAWNPTNIDVGIDGYIETRDGATGHATNCIIQVQSRATEGQFECETDDSFEYRCAAKDLDYWMGGNAPVILVRSRPKTGEAYWVSVKDYFRELGIRKNAKIAFNKVRNRFDQSAKDTLFRLATPLDSGQYLGTKPRAENIYSNLLKLAPLPRHYYVAQTQYRTPPEIFARLREITTAVRGEWLLTNKTMISFHDLRDHPWTAVSEVGTCEEFDTGEWSSTNDAARQRLFVQLLNICLKEKLFPKGIKFSRDHEFYYFRATKDLSDREYSYQSRENRTTRVVFKGYPKKSDHTKMSFYRHSAMEVHFVRYGGEWYLQLTPNYHFTRDGERTSLYAPNLVSGIKRLENNQAVHGQVVMWASVLTERNLFEGGSRFIDFTTMNTFQLEVGIDDRSWLGREEAEKRSALADEGQGTLL
ncbi:MAG TPA: DUF4365 domain-containing protein [Terriglobales bacterium]|nr:DUF4365 domain-containing protein [Terriglobales bacterium]